MAKSKGNYSKKELENRQEKKKKEKEQRRLERKANAKPATSWEDMVAYVDENGNITSTPPDPTKRKEIKEEDIEIGVPRKVVTEEDIIRKGRITFYNDAKGYGFIKDQETQESIFVHVNSALDPIKENDKVTFEVEMGPKGPNAVRVKVVN